MLKKFLTKSTCVKFQCKPAPTSVTTSGKLFADISSPYPDPTLYRFLAGALQYRTFTRPDISYAVQQVCLFMVDHRVAHMAALHRILRYLQILLIMVCNHISPPFPLYFHIRMLIGVDVLTPIVLPLATVCFRVIIWSLGLLNVNLLFLSPVLRLHIVVLPMLFPRHVGFVIYSLSFVVLFLLYSYLL